jgi:dipeptidyl aminopeptidase/acylaminoacyl peptidase
MHNASFDCRFVKNFYGVDLLPSLYVDTILLVHTVNEEGAGFAFASPFGLKSIAQSIQKELGLDVTKEIQFMRGIPDLVKRGFSVLIMDGPGTGEAIRFRNHYLRHDYEVAGSACLDYLEKRSDVDPKKIGIVAISLGGYYAPRCAAMDHRWAACIAWGAQWDYHETWKKRIDAQFKLSLSVPGHHINWILGVDTLDQALETLKPFNLDGVMQKMECPFLLVHGAEDEQIPLSDAQKQYDACGSKDKTLRVYTAEEGGSQHCQRDYLTLVVADMWNWFEDRLIKNPK